MTAIDPTTAVEGITDGATVLVGGFGMAAVTARYRS
jgi:acyl CoA:acetate/3-ketoacid CoA transferase alpha subunit